MFGFSHDSDPKTISGCFEIPVSDSDVELVACQIQLADHSSLIVCSIYRPPSSDNVNCSLEGLTLHRV